VDGHVNGVIDGQGVDGKVKVNVEVEVATTNWQLETVSKSHRYASDALITPTLCIRQTDSGSELH